MTSVHDFRCKKCDKKYYRQTAYDKHIIWCSDNDSPTPLLNSIIEKNGQKNIGTGVLKGVPLQDIVIELINSNIKLRKDVEELKKWVQTKKRKINILEWLNEKTASNPTQKTHKEYMVDLIVSRKDLELVFNTDLITGVQDILEKYFSSNDMAPFQSFDQKDNIIYVYTENSKWELLSTDDFNKMIFKITKQILTEFQKWKQENEHKLYTDHFSTIVIQNTKKVIGGNISLEKQQDKIHRNLYKYFKKNLQNTIEYEFS